MTTTTSRKIAFSLETKIPLPLRYVTLRHSALDMEDTCPVPDPRPTTTDSAVAGEEKEAGEKDDEKVVGEKDGEKDVGEKDGEKDGEKVVGEKVVGEKVVGEKEGGEDNPLLAIITAAVESATYEQVNGVFKTMVMGTAAYEKGSTIDDLPPDRLHERLRGAIASSMTSIAQWLEKIRNDKTLADSNLNVQSILLMEMIRYAYRVEMVTANHPSEEFWRQRKNEVMRCAAKHGYRYDAAKWREFLVAVDEKSKRRRAKREALASSPAATSSDAPAAPNDTKNTDKEAKKDAGKAKRRKDPRTRKRRSLYSEYVRCSADVRLNDPPMLAELCITSNGYLAIASLTAPPDVMLRLEREMTYIIVVTRSSFVMGAAMLKDFIDKYRTTTESLEGAVGTVIVHRPDNVKPEEVDAAVKQFFREHSEDIQDNIAYWNPEEMERLQRRAASDASAASSTDS